MDEDLGIANDNMMQELERDPQFLPSQFWQDLNKKNVEMLQIEGLENFKRTISQNYYNWMVSRRSPMYLHAYDDWRRHPTLAPWLTRIEKDISLRFSFTEESVRLKTRQRRTYKRFVSLIWEMMLRHDLCKLHKKVVEPEVGNPIRVWRGSKLISQDLANSILETNIITNLRADHLSSKPKIAEIGAGYGRVAYVYALTQEGTYFIFDIPPALHVSQWYLSQTLPQKNIFRFRTFDKFSQIEDELATADVAFFTANQFKKFPERYFDTVVSISTLPEMRTDQVSMYLKLFQRMADKNIYLKQWKEWKNPLDGTDIKIDDYILDSDWNLTMNETDIIVPEFFNKVWTRNS